MAEISFITYTRGATQYVTTPQYETQFLNWLNKAGSSVGFERATCSQVAIACCPTVVHAVAKKEATILTLVKAGQQEVVG